jgi:site-specific recombinase XerD
VTTERNDISNAVTVLKERCGSKTIERERYVSLNVEVCEALDAYFKYHREKVADEYGREPLFTIQRVVQYSGFMRHDNVSQTWRPQ